MPSVRDFFVTEANEVIAQLNKLVQRLDGGSTDTAELQRHSRTLRGSAQMAREDRVYRAALGLEAAARSVTSGALAWSADFSSRIQRTLEDLNALVRGGEAEDAADLRVRRTLDRWKEIGIALPEEVPQAAASAQVSEASRQFRQFAAHEVAGIIAEMEVSLETLQAEPRNRDPLKSILRRQRALLGAARLEEIPVIAEALRATEDLTRVIAKLNVPVKEEWLAVFRSARDVLKASLEPLQKGEVPGHTPALSKLRTMRQELLDRYGQGEDPATSALATPAAPPTAPPAPPQAPLPVAQPLSSATDDVVPIEQFCYQGTAALKRALELRPQIEQLAAANPGARESIAEVFDLIQLGIT